jgi:hypothetical protein
LLPAGVYAAGNYLKPGFAFPTDRRARVLVLYPDLFVGALNADNEQVPNAEWTAAAQRNVRAALTNGSVGQVVDLRFMGEGEAAASGVLEDAREAFKWRGSDLVMQAPQGTFPLPEGQTKYRKDKNARYAFAADLAARIRREHGDADFALFLSMHDAYATAGQKLSSILGATATGMVAPRGTMVMRDQPPHHGNAMLVDLRDGAVIWFHGDGRLGGDPRDANGIVKRMQQAMDRFPGTAGKP